MLTWSDFRPRNVLLAVHIHASLPSPERPCRADSSSSVWRICTVRNRPYRAFGLLVGCGGAELPDQSLVHLCGDVLEYDRCSRICCEGMLSWHSTKPGSDVLQVPERWFRRRFDIFGNSHQIMHVMVLCAALVHVFGLIRDFDHLHNTPLRCP